MDNLPLFIFEEIFSYLDYEQNLELKYVSRYWRSALNPLNWSYLEFLGKEDLKESKEYIIKYGKQIRHILLYMKFPCVKKILKLCPKAKIIEITCRNSENFDNYLKYIYCFVPKIHTLRITQLESCSLTFSGLKNLDNLRVFCLSAELHPPETIAKILKNLSPRLKKLTLFLGLISQDIINIISTFVYLEELEISVLSSMSNTDISFPFLRNLEVFYIRFEYPGLYTKEFPLVSPTIFPNLKRLYVHTDSSLLVKELITLNWSNVNFFSVDFVPNDMEECLIKNFKNLTTLEIRNSEIIMDLESLFSSHTNLRQLELFHCTIGLSFPNWSSTSRLSHLTLNQVLIRSTCFATWLLYFAPRLFSLKILDCQLNSRPDSLDTPDPDKIFECLRFIEVKPYLSHPWINFFKTKAPRLKFISR